MLGDEREAEGDAADHADAKLIDGVVDGSGRAAASGGDRPFEVSMLGQARKSQFESAMRAIDWRVVSSMARRAMWKQ